MGLQAKLIEKILLGRSDQNIGFQELCGVLKHLEFQERVRGSHHIFSKDGVQEILNLQSNGSKAKSYQVKQVRGLLLKYKFGEFYE